VQLIGDGSWMIRDLDVHWSGSTHDALVWRNSTAKELLEEQSEFQIVGDSAYPISRSLIKPLRDTPTAQHRQFNKALTALRTVCTENIIGILKRRFPCLRMGLQTRLTRALKIIRATGVLHNLTIVFNDSTPDGTDVDDEQDQEEDDQDGFPGEPVTEAAVRSQGVAPRENVYALFCSR